MDYLLATKSEDVGLVVCAIKFPRFSTYVVMIHQRHIQTDRWQAIARARFAL